MKTTKELLIILKNNIELLTTGLCYLSTTLENTNLITGEERFYIRDYIYNNRPSNKSKLYGGPDNGLLYWPKGDKEPRLRWLNYHIKINK